MIDPISSWFIEASRAKEFFHFFVFCKTAMALMQYTSTRSNERKNIFRKMASRHLWLHVKATSLFVGEFKGSSSLGMKIGIYLANLGQSQIVCLTAKVSSTIETKIASFIKLRMKRSSSKVVLLPQLHCAQCNVGKYNKSRSCSKYFAKLTI